MGIEILAASIGRDAKDLINQRLRPTFEVTWAPNTEDICPSVAAKRYALVILSIDISNEAHIRLVQDCRRLDRHAPILVISPPTQIHERVRALASGIDDYVTHPFDPDELFARAYALVRRCGVRPPESVAAGELQLRADGQILCRGDRLILRKAEHRLLTIMIRQFGRTVGKDFIERVFGGETSLAPNTVEQRILRLRRFLEHVQADVHIRTVRGIGYLLEFKNARPDTTFMPFTATSDAGQH